MKRQFLRVLLIVVLTECIALPQASATDGVWTNNVYDAYWGTANNWVDGQVASGAGATATLRNTVSLRIRQKTIGLTLGRLLQIGADFNPLENSFTFDNNGASPEIYTSSTLTMRSNIESVGSLPILKTGSGTLAINPDNGTNTFSSGITVNEGILSVNPGITTGTPLGTGTITMNGATMNLSKANGIFSAATSSGAKFKFSNMARLWPGTVSLTLGSSSASANSVLERVNYGTLYIDSTTLGGTAKVKVNGGVATSGGMTCLPIFALDSFLTYDETVGFTNVAYTTGVIGGASSIATVETNTTLTSDATVRALKIQVSAAYRNVVLTLLPSATLTVGDGVNPACYFMTQEYNFGHGNISGGTLNFGTSEGVVTFGGLCNANTTWPGISSTIAGSGGLTLVGRASQSRLLIAKNSTYTGPTRIVNGAVALSDNNVTRGFSGDDITIYGNDFLGGQLQFGSFTGTITNTIHVSGVGAAMQWRSGYTKPTGAITFTGTGGTNSGPVELTGDTRFSAPGSTNNYGLISGPISGNYGIEIGYTNIYANEQFGTVRFSGTNTYTGLTKISGGTLELRSPASISQGPYLVSTNLVFNFAGNATFTNVITGSGRIIQNGGGLVRLTKASSFTGTFIANSGEILLGDASATIIVIR